MEPTEKPVFNRAEWEYSFEAWESELGIFAGHKAEELLASKDYSADYEMDRLHVFKLDHNGGYCLVSEQGCSCYETADATGTIYASEADAMAAFAKACAASEA